MQKSERVQAVLTPAERRALQALAESRFEGNASAALRWAVRLAVAVPDAAPTVPPALRPVAMTT